MVNRTDAASNGFDRCRGDRSFETSQLEEVTVCVSKIFKKLLLYIDDRRSSFRHMLDSAYGAISKHAAMPNESINV